MFDRLVASGDITWDNLGVVSIKGRKINGSSITDLISDSVRNRRSGSPIGWRDFTSVLKDINMPTELIGNIQRKNFIRDKHLGRNVSFNDNFSRTFSPRASSSNSSTRVSGVQWEPFTF
jgi:hypothetical protein